jgi:hypothetical protein
MPKKSKPRLIEFPRELSVKQGPIARAAGDAVYLSLEVFSLEDPDDTVELHICLAKLPARQLAAELADEVRKVI